MTNARKQRPLTSPCAGACRPSRPSKLCFLHSWSDVCVSRGLTGTTLGVRGLLLAGRAAPASGCSQGPAGLGAVGCAGDGRRLCV